MEPLSSRLRAARERTGIDVELFARMAGMEAPRLRALEAGAVPDPPELDAIARAVGVRVRDLSGPSEPGGWPLAKLLFRARREDRGPALVALVDEGSYAAVGELLRCVIDLHELEQRLGMSTKPLPRLEVADAEGAPWNADELARQVRGLVGLSAEAPIPSMLDLLTERFGVACFFTTPERMTPSVDAFSTIEPRPAILVNLIEGEHCWWRTRMSLAHELCHLLVDQDAEQPTTLSPERHVRARYVYVQDLTQIEKRAGAFAAHLLAPTPGVQRCVGDRDPRNEEAVRAVGERYGVGRVTAINRLCQVYRLKRSTREQMLERAASGWPSEAHPDQEKVRIGLRSGVLAERALEAFGRGLIDRVEVRRCLGLALTDELPDALSEAHGVEPDRRAAVRTVEQQVLAKASAFLSAHRVGHLAPLRPRRTDQGWQVDLEGAEDPRTLELTFELDVEPPPWLAM